MQRSGFSSPKNSYTPLGPPTEKGSELSKHLTLCCTSRKSLSKEQESILLRICLPSCRDVYSIELGPFNSEARFQFITLLIRPAQLSRISFNPHEQLATWTKIFEAQFSHLESNHYKKVSSRYRISVWRAAPLELLLVRILILRPRVGEMCLPHHPVEDS
jgi:hypothetical protein